MWRHLAKKHICRITKKATMRRSQLEYPANKKRIFSDQLAISLRIETGVQHGITHIPDIWTSVCYLFGKNADWIDAALILVSKYEDNDRLLVKNNEGIPNNAETLKDIKS